jgi:hypothetical protein
MRFIIEMIACVCMLTALYVNLTGETFDHETFKLDQKRIQS